MARPRAARHSGWIAAATSFVVALVIGFAFAGTGLEDGPPPTEARRQAEHAAAVRVALAGGDAEALDAPAAPLAPAPIVYSLLPDADHVRLSDSATRVRIASVGIDAEVRSVGLSFRRGSLEYDTPRVAAGQYVGSAAPGEAGNTVIGGHVATRSGNAVFAHLPEVAVGDLVEVYQGERIFRYEVSELRRVDRDATEAMARSDDVRVTLITCYPDDNFSQRLVVVATLVG